MTEDVTVPVAGTPEEVHPGMEFGRYRVEGVLGWGGMGVVYRGHDPDLARPVAIKVMRPQAGLSRTRLLREGQAVARLHHPNVVAVYDVGVAGEALFIAMELLEEGTLRTWSAGRGWREIVAMYVQAARGLAAAHAAGLVHRDFKPDNVLVSKDGRAVVGDFGLAEDEAAASAVAPAGDALTTASIAGTPAYMAPEQFRGAPADARSDQFSFCVSLWESLFGARPYAGDDVAALAAATALGRPRAIADDRGVPARVRAVLRRGLSPKPADRFPSMDAVVTALTARPGRRFAAVAAGVAVVAVIAAAALWPRGGSVSFVAHPATCDDGAIADVWTADARARYLGEGTDPALVDDVGWFDDYAARIGAMHRASCIAAQLAPADRARNTCLDGAVDDLRAALVRVNPHGFWPELRPLGPCAGAAPAALHPLAKTYNGEAIVVSDDGQRVLDSRPGQGVWLRTPGSDSGRQIPGLSEAIRWGAGGAILGKDASSRVGLFDARDGHALHTLDDKVEVATPDLASAVRIVDDSMVAGTGDGTPDQLLVPHGESFGDPAISDDGTRVLVIGWDGAPLLRLFDHPGGHERRIRMRCHMNNIGDASPQWLDDDHVLLSCSVLPSVTQQPVWELHLGHDGLIGPPAPVVSAPRGTAILPRRTDAHALVVDRIQMVRHEGVYAHGVETGVLPGSANDFIAYAADRSTQRLIGFNEETHEFVTMSVGTWTPEPLVTPDGVKPRFVGFLHGHVVDVTRDAAGWRYFELDGARVVRELVLDVPYSAETSGGVCTATGCVMAWGWGNTFRALRIDAGGVTPVPSLLGGISEARSWGIGDDGTVVVASKTIHVLSGGHERELHVAACGNPQNVFLVEPTSVVMSCVREDSEFLLERVALDGSRADILFSSSAFIKSVVAIDPERLMISTVAYDDDDESLDLTPGEPP